MESEDVPCTNQSVLKVKECQENMEKVTQLPSNFEINESLLKPINSINIETFPFDLELKKVQGKELIYPLNRIGSE